MGTVQDRDAAVQGEASPDGWPRGSHVKRLGVFPEAHPTGKDEATAIRDDVKVLQARIPNLELEKSGVKH